MMQVVLIGLGAGAAAALLFASVASGSLISILLFYLAPLPILIAALGWRAIFLVNLPIAAPRGHFFAARSEKRLGTVIHWTSLARSSPPPAWPR